jgi:hypothetical protein
MKQHEFVPVTKLEAWAYFPWDSPRIKAELSEHIDQQLFITDAPNGRLDLLYQKTPTTLGYLTTK